MAKTVYKLQEAKSSLSRLVDRAAGEKAIIIAKAGKPLACLVPLKRRVAKRESDGWEGQV